MFRSRRSRAHAAPEDESASAPVVGSGAEWTPAMPADSDSDPGAPATTAARAAGAAAAAVPPPSVPLSLSLSLSSGRRYRICIVSDFFYPRLGGVELHQYSLAQALLARGHKVVVVTGTYDADGQRRQGVRFVTNGLKVYYCPVLSISQQASLPNLFSFFPLFRSILLRERIELVHGHQSTSSLAHEAILHARTMGVGCVFTDHSLFSFANAPAINLNKLMKFTLTDIQHVICVSHCSKENLCLRAYLDPEHVSVIPNAVDTTNLTPDTHNAPDIRERFTIVVLSRLVYRKGMDLIIDVIPVICARYPNVHFLIGGDGPKRVLLEEMREKHALQDRVEMIGAVAHEQVRSVLTRGHLFLNCSLTEAFCIAILEAVACGLYVVSTRVGGVPEILPRDMVAFADPTVPALVDAIAHAIAHVRSIAAGETAARYAQRVHRAVRHMYNWHDVARRTETVYAQVVAQVEADRDRDREREAEAERDQGATSEPTTDEGRLANQSLRGDSDPAPPLCSVGSASSVAPSVSWCRESGPALVSLSRLHKFYVCGPFAGPLFVCVVLFNHLLWLLLRWAQPADQIDLALDLPPSVCHAPPMGDSEEEDSSHVCAQAHDA